MRPLPVRDRAGNALVDVRAAGSGGLPVPCSLVVVELADTVLLMFDSWRRQWELPGGTRESGETARQAAVRELAEETGIHTGRLAFAAIAEFDLVAPVRRECAAVYRTSLTVAPRLVVNDEALDFRWWDPHAPVTEEMSPLDAEITRRVIHPNPG